MISSVSIPQIFIVKEYLEVEIILEMGLLQDWYRSKTQIITGLDSWTIVYWLMNWILGYYINLHSLKCSPISIRKTYFTSYSMVLNCYDLRIYNYHRSLLMNNHKLKYQPWLHWQGQSSNTWPIILELSRLNEISLQVTWEYFNKNSKVMKRRNVLTSLVPDKNWSWRKSTVPFWYI